MSTAIPNQWKEDFQDNITHQNSLLEGERSWHTTYVWMQIGVCIAMCIIGTISNVLVIYFANQTDMTGSLQYLNRTVRNLAVADLLYSILGAPLALVYGYWGKSVSYIIEEFLLCPNIVYLAIFETRAIQQTVLCSIFDYPINQVILEKWTPSGKMDKRGSLCYYQCLKTCCVLLAPILLH